MSRDQVVVALAVIVDLGVFLVDAFLFPGTVIPIVFYAVPILIVACLLSPRRVAGVAVLTLALESLSAALERTPFWLWATDTLALGLIGYLATMLASRIGREAALAGGRMQLLGRAEAEVAERRRAEEALRSANQALQIQARVLENSPDLIAVIDRRYTYTMVNPAFARLRQKSAEEIVGHTVAEILGEEVFRDLVQPNIERAFAGESVTYEARFSYPVGQRCIEVHYYPIPGDGRVANAVAVMRDVTERKQAEEERGQLLDQVREALRLREEFLAAAAHELKTPVTMIKGYVQTMRKWAPAGHEPREGQAFEVINAQCDRLNRRVQEMLALAQLRTTPREPRRVRFDLGELAAEVTQRAQVTTGAHRLLVRREDPAPVEADREHVEEVLASLVDNAVRYSPAGGEVELRVAVEDGEAVVLVRDHGVGISRERQEHVFEPFYESVPSGAPGYQSVVTLSLYLSKLIVERHGGRIWFESEEDKGSSFYFSLPLAGGDGGRE